MAALAHVALGFVTQGQNTSAEPLLRDIVKTLPSMPNPFQQSAVWTTATITRIRLGDYAAVYEREGVLLG
jgi:hypothetical protein